MSCAMYPSLRGRAVLVTGGATGIGASVVEHFCGQGADTAFLDFDVTAGKDLAARTGARFLACDLRDIAALRAAVAAVGDVAVLVNNAARDDRHALETVEPEFWDERMATNLRHQFFAAQAVAPAMKAARAGSIINMGSVSWLLSQGGMPAYTAAKSAVRGLTRGLARDLGGYGIRVNEIIPGWIFTERQEALWATPESVAETMKRQCIPEKLRAPDVARMALWLAADDSRMVTAQSFVVDGGSI
ncbi:NAD(P)-dependent dehydrogenase (short-subunit alcohol dehydrogenase family) [Humitalea rosea]|uniref:NAD(P)-dependent dehydrogenase (Short-subunit alcohol dehydrogenase family) n=1 Tax=Humitalea rosea TaxID=990373 RepID=A0A2W7IE95_9PROT|nr:SDR family oxidoreductase [Humitalea rosea]PZW45065.1 NAD(P)-dependent dehydrogenase (short-subunit alcohol dehydrogenase family) [Humitalea rosea]